MDLFGNKINKGVFFENLYINKKFAVRAILFRSFGRERLYNVRYLKKGAYL